MFANNKNNSLENGRFFRELATLLDAGLSVKDAVSRLQTSKERSTRTLTTVVAQLARGRSFAQAFAQTRLINHEELETLAVGEKAGELPKALKSIAKRYEQRKIRIGRLKSKLLLSYAIFVVAMLAKFSKNVMGSAQLSFIEGLGDFIVELLFYGLVSYWVIYLLKRDSSRWLALGWAYGFSNNSLYQRFFELYWYRLLAWQLEAGVDFLSAIRQMKSLMNVSSYQKNIKKCLSLVQKGEGMTESLSSAGLIFTPFLKQNLVTGENTGNWNDSLNNYLRLESDEIALKIKTFDEWLPRIYYSLTLLIALFLFI